MISSSVCTKNESSVSSNVPLVLIEMYYLLVLKMKNQAFIKEGKE